jgi:hypothetical protein
MARWVDAYSVHPTLHRKEPDMPANSLRRAWNSLRDAHRANNDEWNRRIERPQAQRPWGRP